MKELQGGLLVLLIVGGTAVVLMRDPLRQALLVGIYGLLLALLFFALGAPDVALSQIVVCTVAVPVMILLTLAKVSGHERDDEQKQKTSSGGERE